MVKNEKIINIASIPGSIYSVIERSLNLNVQLKLIIDIFIVLHAFVTRGQSLSQSLKKTRVFNVQYKPRLQTIYGYLLIFIVE